MSMVHEVRFVKSKNVPKIYASTFIHFNILFYSHKFFYKIFGDKIKTNKNPPIPPLKKGEFKGDLVF
jgi:hypothetical protein